MKNNKVSLLVYCGLFAALVVIATAVLKIPIPGGYGYVHLGDGFIFAAAAMLGPLAAVVSGVGSALADILAGYAQYALGTLLIKALMGFLAAKLIADAGKYSVRNALVYALAELVMVAGYFLCDTILGGVATAVVAVGFNVVQGAFGILLGILLSPIVKRIFAPKA